MFITFLEQYPYVLAFLLGLIPALIWMWFWLKEDAHPEPARILTLSFLGGMVAVLFALPIQRLIYDLLSSFGVSCFTPQDILCFSLWAAIEEIVKFVFVYFIALQRKTTDEPIDDIIYLIVSALGFVTLENTLFLRDLVQQGAFLDIIQSDNLRFIGASLLHVMSSATIGIMMALSFYKSKITKAYYLIIGLILAISLHSIFNLLIMNNVNIFLTFGLVWAGIIAILLLFEKVKKVSNTA